MLNRVEQHVLLAIAHLGDEPAYGVSLRAEIERRSGRPVSVTAVYAALDRLEREGLVASTMSEPRAERGGRARKEYRLLAAGADALAAERRTWERMWRGLDLEAFEAKTSD
jgi:DNA-binding PadR family transcriptional regulator